MRQRAAWWLCAMLWMVSVQAQEVPLWELGVGVGVTNIPDYPGSNESHTYVLPIPYISYNGERFRVDRQGVRGDIMRGNNIWLDVSANLGPPVNSDDNEARAGMPDLDLTLEFGPSVRWMLLSNDRGDRTFTLYLPARAVIATDFSHSHGVGWVFAPHLTYDHLNFGPGGGWDFSASFGPLYATEEYHDYYYEVLPQFATPTRPAYNADAGYSGLRSAVSLSKRFRDFWVGAFIRYDNLNHATFEDSPLMRKNGSLTAGAGVSWILTRSQVTVPAYRPGLLNQRVE